MRIFAWSVAALLLLSSHASADIRITEVMSNSGGGTPDWFELTNFSGTAVDVSGWKMDDNSFNLSNAVLLNGVTSVGAGESVVFVEGDSTAANTFKTFWIGATPPSGLQVGYYSGSGVSFSSSADGAVIFN
ncbi:MAG: lamin tail domain-containing protein, partial [Planctomycetota bacterium]